MVSYFGSFWCFECLLNVCKWWVHLEAFDALNIPLMLAYGELLWKWLMLWMFLECSHMVSYFRSVRCFKCSLTLAYGKLLWKPLMLCMFLECSNIVSYFGSVWCLEWSLNFSIWWVTLEVFDIWMFLEC